MKKFLLLGASILLLSVSSLAQASIKVGVAIDMDLSIVAQIDKYNIVLGDNGFAVDYQILSGKFDQTTPLSWYVSGGGFAGWDHGFGLRVPLGVKWDFAPNWDLYGQVHPVADFDDGFDFSVNSTIDT